MRTSLPCEKYEFTDRKIRELQSQTDEAKRNDKDTRSKLLPVFRGLQTTGKVELNLKVEAKLRKRLKIKSAANRLHGVLCTGWSEACRQMAKMKKNKCAFSRVL